MWLLGTEYDGGDVGPYQGFRAEVADEHPHLLVDGTRQAASSEEEILAALARELEATSPEFAEDIAEAVRTLD